MEKDDLNQPHPSNRGVFSNLIHWGFWILGMYLVTGLLFLAIAHIDTNVMETFWLSSSETMMGISLTLAFFYLPIWYVIEKMQHLF